LILSADTQKGINGVEPAVDGFVSDARIATPGELKVTLNPDGTILHKNENVADSANQWAPSFASTNAGYSVADIAYLDGNYGIYLSLLDSQCNKIGKDVKIVGGNDVAVRDFFWLTDVQAPVPEREFRPALCASGRHAFCYESE
jgi:hypothetical protein